ncbi:11193_t:CDS:2, partial [Acaulospora morrowiae]
KKMSNASFISHLLKIWRQARLPWRSRMFIGIDLSGNEYYETVEAINGRKKRMVEMKEEKPLSEYNTDDVPVQWQSWLRHTRLDPPTIEEVTLANKRRELIIQRAKALDREWEERKLAISRVEAINSTETISEEASPSKPIKDSPFGAQTIPGDAFEPEPWKPVTTKK